MTPRPSCPDPIECSHEARANAAEAERDKLAQRIRQMADAWEQQLPEVIRTPAVVSALRAAVAQAAPHARMVQR